MPTVDIGPRKIKYAVIRGTSRKFTYFRFRDDLTLEVTVPRGKQVDVEKAIIERSTWLHRQFDRLSMTRNVLGRDQVMFDGRMLRVVYAEDPGDSLVPELTKGVVIVRASDARRIRELVRRWFLTQSSAYVVKKVAEVAPKMRVRPSRVDVREIGKWGYCTRGGRISFSWQLIALPERLREYVVLHELTHLLHFDHSPAFKRKLATYCPDFRARERELNLVAPYDRLAPP